MASEVNQSAAVNAFSAAQPPLAATILAAGLGQRLGWRAKATLQIGGLSLLERLVAALQQAGMATVSVVVGPYREQLLPLIERSGAIALTHRLASPSLIDSQRLALDMHQSRFCNHDLLLVLADLPLLGAADIAPLVSAWHRRATSVHAQIPLVDGTRGHPLLLSRHAVAQVAAMPRHLGVRYWMQQNPEAVQSLPRPNPAYVTDLDTPDDVIRLRKLVEPLPVLWPSPCAQPEDR